MHFCLWLSIIRAIWSADVSNSQLISNKAIKILIYQHILRILRQMDKPAWATDIYYDH